MVCATFLTGVRTSELPSTIDISCLSDLFKLCVIIVFRVGLDISFFVIVLATLAQPSITLIATLNDVPACLFV